MGTGDLKNSSKSLTPTLPSKVQPVVAKFDATIVPVPKQRNRRKENEEIKQGKVHWQDNLAKGPGCQVDQEEWCEPLRIQKQLH